MRPLSNRARRRLALAVLTGLLALGGTASAPAQPTAGCLGKPATIVGTDGDDVIRGTDRRDVIVGLGGNDAIDGLGGADTICGGDGNDVISTGEGYRGTEFPTPPDVVSGDGGDDELADDTGGYGFAVVSFEEAPGPVVVNLVTHRATGWGDDLLRNDFGVTGSAYADSITGDDSYNRLSGGPGDDRLFGLDASDTLEGGPGNDTLDGGKARSLEPHEDAGDLAGYAAAPRGVVADLVSGRATGWGNDRLVGIEFVEGSRHADRLLGGPRSNILYGLAGDDVLLGGKGNDWSWGGAGDDLVVGGDGHDRLRGEGAGRRDTGIRVVPPGNDRLWGGRGNDDLVGDGGRDSLKGGPGADRLGESDPGNDTIDGGAGDDWAVYEFAPRGVVANLASGRVSGWGQDRLAGIEQLIGSRFADRLFGSPRNDGIYGRGGADLVSGASGNDALFGEDGNDRILGGPGRDALDGGAGRDSLDGGPGRDRCTTGERNRGCP
jgi:Ca2+-binding RTX toxin-like protein